MFNVISQFCVLYTYLPIEYKVKTVVVRYYLFIFVCCLLFIDHFDFFRTVISIPLFAIGNSSRWLSFVRCVLVLKCRSVLLDIIVFLLSCGKALN